MASTPRIRHAHASSFHPQCAPHAGVGTRIKPSALTCSHAVATMHGALQSIPMVTWPTLDGPLECCHLACGLLRLLSPLARFQGSPGLRHVSAVFLRQTSQSVCTLPSVCCVFILGQAAVPILEALQVLLLCMAV